MGDLLVQLIPTALVGAVAPIPITLVITFLMSERGLAKAVTFTAALTGVLALGGAIALATASTDAGDTERGAAVTGTIIAVMGAVMLVLALKQLAGAPDPDAEPPKLMARLDTMSPLGAAGLGAITAVINVKQLVIYAAGVSQIVNADVSTGQGWVALIVLLVLIQIGLIVTLGAFLLARDWATGVLERCRAWLTRHNRVISIVLGLVVGAAFLAIGIADITA